MKSVWTHGLEETVAKEIRGDFKSSLLVRKRLISILDDKYAEFEKASLNTGNYDLSNWAYTQAVLIGYKRAIRMVQNLLEE